MLLLLAAIGGLIEGYTLHSSLLLIVLCNMAGYLSDFDDVDDNFEYNGRPYRSE